MSRIVFVDTEVSAESGKVCDFGAVNAENEKLHTRSEQEFAGLFERTFPPATDLSADTISLLMTLNT